MEGLLGIAFLKTSQLVLNLNLTHCVGLFYAKFYSQLLTVKYVTF